MPINIHDLVSDERTIEVEWLGETFSITYQPSAYTPSAESIFVSSIKGDLPGNAFAKYLATLLVGWEVLDDDGNEIGHDFETLSQMPTDFLSYLFSRITDDMIAGREDRKNSGAGSPKRARSASARNGTR